MFSSLKLTHQTHRVTYPLVKHISIATLQLDLLRSESSDIVLDLVQKNLNKKGSTLVIHSYQDLQQRHKNPSKQHDSSKEGILYQGQHNQRAITKRAYSKKGALNTKNRASICTQEICTPETKKPAVCLSRSHRTARQTSTEHREDYFGAGDPHIRREHQNESAGKTRRRNTTATKRDFNKSHRIARRTAKGDRVNYFRERDLHPRQEDKDDLGRKARKSGTAKKREGDKAKARSENCNWRKIEEQARRRADCFRDATKLQQKVSKEGYSQHKQSKTQILHRRRKQESCRRKTIPAGGASSNRNTRTYAEDPANCSNGGGSGSAGNPRICDDAPADCSEGGGSVSKGRSSTSNGGG